MSLCAASIIVVSYNTRDLLAECLQSVLASQSADQTEVWVVDNASTDGSPELVAATFPAVQLIRNCENRGFAAANNQALAQARGRLLFLLNSDARVIGDACGRLQEALAADPQVGIAGPRVLNSDGSSQPSWGMFPNLWSEIAFQTFLFKVWPSDMPYGRRVHPFQRNAYQKYRRVDWVSGVALMMRREVYQEVGGLPEDTFMYTEDMEYCWRARQTGYSTAYCPAACIIHHGQASAGRDYQRWIMQYTGAWLNYYWRHTTPAQFREIALLIGAGSYLRLALWRLVGLLRPARRAEASSRILGYAGAMALTAQAMRGRR